MTGWAIVGGADALQFAIGETAGELSFREAPDFEVPTDAASSDPPSGAQDNEYIVVVACDERRGGEGADGRAADRREGKR